MVVGQTFTIGEIFYSTGFASPCTRVSRLQVRAAGAVAPVINLSNLGLVLLAEPMLTMGSIGDRMWDDNWTVVTEDGSLSAQFEHSLLITETSVETLTVC